MRWFEGDIAQAVGQSRAKNAVFVVFLEGKDEASQSLANAINDPEVSSKLEGDNFVAIHFESGTPTFNQFSQIYRNPPVPSLYFIGRSGAPIDVVTQAPDPESLLQNIVRVESIHLGKPTQTSSTQAATSISSTSDETREGLTSEATTSAALDHRVERAKELLEEKRMAKKIQEEEEARQKEIQRRKEGQSVQELRRWQQEQEMKQLKEERMREKRLEHEARQRVLEQIAQDRANRNARNSTLTSSPAPVQSTTAQTTSQCNNSEARLQFRLPDGSTHTHSFDADVALSAVRQYVEANLVLPFRDFALATAFPRHEFSPEDYASTLRDLQLVPSSVMHIVPVGASAAVHPTSPVLFGFVATVLNLITYPVNRIFSFFRLMFFAGPPSTNNANSNAATSSGSSQPHSQPNAQHERRTQRRSGGAYRRAGNSNVHRLHQNNSSSDDENNTWNGNSTQQM